MRRFGHQGIPAFRRVFKQDGTYRCGICRTGYKTTDDAHNCLSQCWQDFLNSEPVIRRSYHGKPEFRCKLCARDYGSYAEAKDCFALCREKAGPRFEQEIKLSQVDITADFVRPKRSFKRPKLVAVAAPQPVLAKEQQTSSDDSKTPEEVLDQQPDENS